MTAAVPTIEFDTQAFAPATRFDRWRGSMSSLYDLAPADDAETAGFGARSTAWHLGAMIVNTGTYQGGQKVRRTAALIRRDQIDHYKLQLRLAGGLQVDADGHAVSVVAGDVVVEDLSRPSHYLAQGGSNIVVYIAREALDDLTRHPGSMHGAMVRGAAGAVLTDHLQSLARNLPLLRTQAARDIAAVTTLLVAACVTPTPEALDRARPAIEVTVTRQICRYIECHLTEPFLSADSLCAFFHISRAKLYRLLAPLGGVQGFIRERRLMRVHAILLEAAGPIHLSRLAEDHGFSSASDFSRAFRTQFGYAPRDARLGAAAAGVALPPATDAEAEFNRWMGSVRS